MDNELKPVELDNWLSDTVVAENFMPKAVFHGTREAFTEFDYSKTSSRSNDGTGKLGFFFSEDRDVARYFTDDENEIILEAYLSIKNPLVMSADEFESDFADLSPFEAAIMHEKWKSQGYDGIKIESGGLMIDHKAPVWVAFESKQIKILGSPWSEQTAKSRPRP